MADYKKYHHTTCTTYKSRKTVKIQIEMLNTNIEENEEVMKKMEEENIKLKTEGAQLQNQNEELKTKIKATEKEEVQDHQVIVF